MHEHHEKLKLIYLVWLAVFMFEASTLSQAQAGESLLQQVAPDVQAKIMLNSISYCKSKSVDKAAEIVIALVYNESIPTDRVETIKAAFEKNKSTKIGKKTFSMVAISFSSTAELKTKLSEAKANMAYIVRGSDAGARKAVSVTRSLKILSMAGDPNHVHWLGVCLGVEDKSGKRKILINLSGCKIEGVNFDPRLLRIASVSF